MKYFLEYVVNALVDHSEDVDIQQVENDRSTVFYVHLHPDDVGKVIGRNGHTINAIRNVLCSAAKENRRVQIEIVEEADGNNTEGP